jgi:hypothetical protein
MTDYSWIRRRKEKGERRKEEGERRKEEGGRKISNNTSY